METLLNVATPFVVETDVVPLSEPVQAVQIAAQGERRVDWRVRAKSHGEAIVRVKAVTDEDSDAMEMRFPCHVHGMMKTDTFAGSRRSEDSVGKLTLTVPAELRVDQARLEVRYAPTLERLLDETVLLLHRPEEALSEIQRNSLTEAREMDPMLAGRKILVVDDDLRNIFALTSVLEQHEIVVLHAETGRAGIHLLEKNPDVDLVLMDIMMPEMDGYETMQVIRQKAALRRLPIIALTAKAMKGDREKCLEAGASEYLAKPVNTEQLLSALRMWLHR